MHALADVEELRSADVGRRRARLLHIIGNDGDGVALGGSAGARSFWNTQSSMSTWQASASTASR